MLIAFQPTDEPHATDAPAPTRDGERVDRGRRWWCARCMTVIADELDACQIAGAHRHRFVNPDDVEFEIGCFANAACRAVGAPTFEATWFAGYAWSFALCRNCGEHLGWRYDSDGGAPAFYGLVCARLLGPI